MVRLGLGPQGIFIIHSTSFQSHCGAIGTGSRAASRLPLLGLSIPLWCDWDEECVGGQANGQLTFNPTVVRLGHPYLKILAAAAETFNPTVVRLGLTAPTSCLLAFSTFQSHCGAIGTEKSCA